MIFQAIHRDRDDRRALGMLIVAAALTSMLMLSSNALGQQRVADSDIAAAIEREFLYDDAVPFNRIDAHSEDGIVTLSGRVSNLAARSQAEALASIVKGVHSVVNRLVVEASERAPAEIEAALRQAFELDGATESYAIDVDVDAAGVATLTGVTDSWAERSLAETVATTVAGVTAVDNQLRVDASRTHRGPGEIHDEATSRMRWDVRIDNSLVTVLVRDGGRILLSGTVGSLAEKRLAEELSWVQGVMEVDASNLDVEPWARDEDLRRGEAEEVAEDEIQPALRLALRYDPRVLETPIDVSVLPGGNVWLRGRVDTFAAKSAAERDAYNTVGVSRVYNRLKVRPGTLVDRDIEELATNAMRGKGLLDDAGNDVEISVADGQARLTGDVDSLVDYWQIDQTVSAIRGIEELRNELTVRGQAPRLATNWFGYFPRGVTPTLEPEFVGPGYHTKTDRELYQDVESELYWSPFVDKDEVHIDVEDGIVTLRGTVESRREASAARDNAYQAGARSVRNELLVAAPSGQ